MNAKRMPVKEGVMLRQDDHRRPRVLIPTGDWPIARTPAKPLGKSDRWPEKNKKSGWNAGFPPLNEGLLPE
jgi:hypothetical protein